MRFGPAFPGSIDPLGIREGREGASSGQKQGLGFLGSEETWLWKGKWENPYLRKKKSGMIAPMGAFG